MIKVTFIQNTQDGTITMKMSGHSGLECEKDKDIVCAGASAYAYMVAQCVLFAEAEGGKLQKKPNVQLEPGKTYIKVKPTMDAYGEMLHIFFCAQVGYHLLSNTYPDNVQLTPFGKSVVSD